MDQNWLWELLTLIFINTQKKLHVQNGDWKKMKVMESGFKQCSNTIPEFDSLIFVKQTK